MAQNASFEEKGSFPILFKTLELLLAVLDLVATNKALRATWDERKMPILTLVRDLTAKKLGAYSHWLVVQLMLKASRHRDWQHASQRLP